MFQQAYDFCELQERDRGIPAPKRLTLTQRRNRDRNKALEAEARRFKFAYISGDAVEEAQADVNEFMQLRFQDYIPLQHHLPRYKVTQYLDLHSKETPVEDKNLTMAYTGGAQTEASLKERFGDYMRPSTCAKKREEEDLHELIEEDAVE